MNQSILQTAMTRVTTDLRQALIRVVDHLRKVPYYGIVFEKPVDYVGIPLPDYLDIVKRPMDFQMLRKNLVQGEYEFLYEFLHDADLIWTNCRRYNLDNPNFKEISDYMEETFMLQLDKLEVRITPDVYKIIISSNIPQMKPDTRQFSATRLQCLMKELCDLPEPQISECVYFLLNEKNELNLIHGSDINLRLCNCSYQLLEKFEQMVLEKREMVKQELGSENEEQQEKERETIDKELEYKVPKKRGRKKKVLDE